MNIFRVINSGSTCRSILKATLIAVFSALLLNSCSTDNLNHVEVSEFFPQEETSKHNNITIKFDKDIVNQEQVEEVLEVLPFTIEPPIPGRAKWVDRKTLRYYTTEAFKPSTNYTLSLINDELLSEPMKLKGETEFHFFTPRVAVKVVTYNVDKDRDDHTAVFTVYVEFTEKIDPKILADYIDVNINGIKNQPELKITNSSATDKFTIRTEPVKLTEKSDEIKVTIQAGLSCIDGTETLKEDYVSLDDIEKAKRLVVERMDAQSVGGKLYRISIRFSDAVNLESAKQNIEVKTNQDLDWESSWRNVTITGQFEPGSSLFLSIAKGLRSVNGAILGKTFTRTLIMADLNPSINFAAKGSYLSRKGLKNVEIEVVNTKKIHLEVEKIYINNIVHYYRGSQSRHSRRTGNLGKIVYSKDVTLDLPRNQVNNITINFEEFLEGHAGGLFKLRISERGRYYRSKTKTVLLTDIGLIVKGTADNLAVWAISTDDLQPLSNVDIRLISTTNQEIITGRTDNIGYLSLAGLDQYRDEFKPYLITASQDENWSYLLLSNSEIPISDFDVNGRPLLTDGYEAFIYTDRGVYRPGDDVRIASIIRKPNIVAPESFPIHLKITDPNGQTFSEQYVKNQTAGLADFTIHLPKYAKTGRYVANLYGAEKQPIGFAKFNVEEFMPERIKVEIDLQKNEFNTGEAVKLELQGNLLFGPPAAGRKFETYYSLESVPFRPKNYGTFRYGSIKKKFSRINTKLGSGKLDESGKASINFTIPKDIKPNTPLKGVLTATVFENGGRSVTSVKKFDVHPYPRYLGLERSNEGYGEINLEEEFKFVVLSKDGELVPIDMMEAELYRIRWNSILRRSSSGSHRYVSEKTETLVSAKTIQSGESKGTFNLKPDNWGRHKVVLRDPETGYYTSITFHVSGRGYSPWSMENPDRIEMELDKKEYQPGETAKVLVKAPFSGRLLLTVERNEVLFRKSMMIEENSAEIEIPVSELFRPNVYVTAILIKSQSSLEKHAPSRAYGTIPLYVEKESKSLVLDIDIPDESLPRLPLEVNISLYNQQTVVNSPVYVTIAVVDEGVLQITDYKTPDPLDYFYGKKSLSVKTHDIFGMMLPEVEESEIYSSPSGDAAIRKSHLMPVNVTRVKTVAFWSGIIELDGQNRATIKFAIPEFNGSLRVMAVASSGDLFGSAHRNIIIRDPIVLTPSFPRFAAPSDRFQVPVMVYNGTGKSGDIKVTLSGSGPYDIEGVTSHILSINDGSEGQCFFSIKSHDAIGKAVFTLTAESAKVTSSRTIELAIRPPAPPTSIVSSGVVAALEPAIISLPHDWLPGSAKYQLSLMSFPAVELASSLQYLLRYPYGCIEQTTSKAFPLLYFRELALAAEPEIYKTNAPEYYVTEAIDRIISMQIRNGGFGYWPSSSNPSNWGSLYAMHFLLEARNAGFVIPKKVIKKGLKYVREIAEGRQYRWRKRNQRYYNSKYFLERLTTYAVYILALGGKPERGLMNSLLDKKAAKLGLDSRLFLSGAFAFSGDLGSAYKLIPASLKPKEVTRETGGTFNSSVRTNAIILNILADVEPDHPSIPLLVKNLTDATKMGRWHTTQDNAWALLAIGKTLKDRDEADYTGTISIGDSILAKFDTESFSYVDPIMGQGEIKVDITGQGLCYYFWESRGISPDNAYPEADNGIYVRRQYHYLDGSKVNLDSVSHGELLIGKITIKTLKQHLDNVIIDDMLPAGFEIENPRLQKSENINWIPPKRAKPQYMDIRDDRLLLFSDLRLNKTYHFYYTIRAVTVGEFVIPPISAECMYDPGIKSVSSSGMLKIIKSVR